MAARQAPAARRALALPAVNSGSARHAYGRRACRARYFCGGSWSLPSAPSTKRSAWVRARPGPPPRRPTICCARSRRARASGTTPASPSITRAIQDSPAQKILDRGRRYGRAMGYVLAKHRRSEVEIAYHVARAALGAMAALVCARWSEARLYAAVATRSDSGMARWRCRARERAGLRLASARFIRYQAGDMRAG